MLQGFLVQNRRVHLTKQRASSGNNNMWTYQSNIKTVKKQKLCCKWVPTVGYNPEHANVHNDLCYTWRKRRKAVKPENVIPLFRYRGESIMPRYKAHRPNLLKAFLAQQPLNIQSIELTKPKKAYTDISYNLGLRVLTRCRPCGRRNLELDPLVSNCTTALLYSLIQPPISVNWR